MARGLTLAVWIFCVNCVFTIFQEVDPFQAGLNFGLGTALIDAATSASNITGISFLGIPEMVMAINLFLSLVLGPFILVPDILNLIGIVGILKTVITGAVWFIYGWFIFQIISGRMLKEVA